MSQMSMPIKIPQMRILNMRYIRSLAPKKAQGGDRIPHAAWWYVQNKMFKIMNEIWSNNSLPDMWRDDYENYYDDEIIDE